MTTIKATCPDCGEVSLTPDEMALHVDSSGAGRSSYEFVCPACGDEIRKPADERIVRLLMSGGVPVVEEASTPTAERRFSGPALTHDDLLDFHTLLESEDWFARLLEVDRRHHVA